MTVGLGRGLAALLLVLASAGAGCLSEIAGTDEACHVSAQGLAPGLYERVGQRTPNETGELTGADVANGSLTEYRAQGSFADRRYPSFSAPGLDRVLGEYDLVSLTWRVDDSSGPSPQIRLGGEANLSEPGYPLTVRTDTHDASQIRGWLDRFLPVVSDADRDTREDWTAEIVRQVEAGDHQVTVQVTELADLSAWIQDLEEAGHLERSTPGGGILSYHGERPEGWPGSLSASIHFNYRGVTSVDATETTRLSASVTPTDHVFLGLRTDEPIDPADARQRILDRFAATGFQDPGLENLTITETDADFCGVDRPEPPRELPTNTTGDGGKAQVHTVPSNGS